MKLRKSAAIRTIIIGFLLAGLSAGTGRLFVAQQFSKIDRDHLRTSSRNITRLFREELDGLSVKAGDYGLWDVAYQIIKNKRTDLIAKNFPNIPQNLGTIKAHLLALYDRKGQYIWGITYDPESRIDQPLPASLAHQLSRLIGTPGDSLAWDIKGIGELFGKPLLFAGRGSFKSDGSGPAAGIIVIGLALNSIELSRLSDLAGTRISLAPPGKDHAMRGSTSIVADVGARIPVFFEQPRVFDRLKEPVEMALFLSALLVWGASALLSFALVERLILKRIDRIAQRVDQVTRTQDFSVRVEDKGGPDELTRMADAINQLMETIQKHSQTIFEQQKQLIVTQKLAALGVLAAGVAHEIGNPLTILTMNLGLLKRKIEPLDENTKREFLQFIQNQTTAVDRISGVVNGIRLYARPSIEGITSVNLHEIITETLSFFEGLLNAERIRVEIRLESQAPWVRANPGELRQVLLNLLSNAKDALKSIPSNREISITTLDDSGGVNLVFTDNGPGVPAKALDKIFDPFFSTKEAGKGTGLGLSITHSIVRSLEGKITAKSAPDAGATFTIWLPHRLSKSA